MRYQRIWVPGTAYDLDFWIVVEIDGGESCQGAYLTTNKIVQPTHWRVVRKRDEKNFVQPCIYYIVSGIGDRIQPLEAALQKKRLDEALHADFSYMGHLSSKNITYVLSTLRCIYVLGPTAKPLPARLLDRPCAFEASNFL